MLYTLLNLLQCSIINLGCFQSYLFWCCVLFFVFTHVFFLHSLYLRYEKQLLFKKYDIPFAKPHILFGSFYYFNKRSSKHENEIEIMEKWIKTHGKVFGYYIGTTPSLVVTDLDFVKDILVLKASNYLNRPKLAIKAEPVMETLVGLRDQRWKEVRNMLSHAFTSAKIKILFEIMNEKLDILISIIDNYNIKNKQIDCLSLYQGLTLDIISKCAFAMETDCMVKQNKDPFFAAVRDFLIKAKNAAIMWAEYFPIVAALMTIINNYWTKSGKATQMIIANLKTAINKRRQSLNEERKDILQIILENSNSSSITSTKERLNRTNPLTDREIIANSWVFLLGGYETTASALSFTSYLLAKHPDIQEKLFQEIKIISKNESETINYEDISTLSYLDQVLNESMRLYPPVATFLRREAKEEDELVRRERKRADRELEEKISRDFRGENKKLFWKEINKVKIPKGMNILIPIWHIHHNPNHWPDPFKFDPERFSQKNKLENKRHQMAFIPFGVGPRNCIGMRFGQTAAKLALIRILSKYRLELCETTPDPLPVTVQTVTLLPEKGIFIKAIRRDLDEL